MPIYQVRQKEGGADVRLVDAKNGVTALKHVTSDMFEVELCDGKDLFRLAANGVELEIAEPEPTQTSEAKTDPPAATTSETQTSAPPDSSKSDDFGPLDDNDDGDDLNASRAASEG